MTPTTAAGPSQARQRRQRPRSKAGDGIWQRQYGLPVEGLNPTGGPSVFTLGRPEWKTSGLCLRDGSDLWFSEHRTLKSQRAATVCQSCPIRGLCLAAALVFDEEFGIWGGLTPAERRPLVARLEAGEPLGIVLAGALGAQSEAQAA